MSQPQSADTILLARVDALYGPGTVSAWYLTILACAISWTLHDRKRKQDTIDMDLVASLTLPFAAIVNLLTHISKLSRQPLDDANTQQELADAIEAPLVLIEAFMNIAAVLFLIAAWSINIRRALVIGVGGFLCFATDGYLHLSSVKSLGLSRLFNRNFVTDSAIALIFISVSLSFLVLAAAAVASVFCFNHRRSQFRSLRRLEMENQQLEAQVRAQAISGRSSTLAAHPMRETQMDQLALRMITVLTTLFLPVTFCASLFAISGSNTSATFTRHIDQGSGEPASPRASMPSLMGFLFPRSLSSLNDLDQRVALAGGLAALGFNMYSVSAIWVNKWIESQRREMELRGEENMRLRRLLGGAPARSRVERWRTYWRRW